MPVLILAVLAALALPAATSTAQRPDARASASCRPFGADFAPSSGDPQRLRVRFSVYRFGRNRPVYLHYIGPNHHLKQTVRLGTTSGRCGFMRTGYRRLFPFTARPGTWRLRFDIRRNYRVRARAPFVTLAVQVLRNR